MQGLFPPASHPGERPWEGFSFLRSVGALALLGHDEICSGCVALDLFPEMPGHTDPPQLGRAGQELGPELGPALQTHPTAGWDPARYLLTFWKAPCCCAMEEGLDKPPCCWEQARGLTEGA